MAEITPLIQQYNIDFASNNNFLFVKAVQGDGYGTRYVDISLMNNGQPYEVDSTAVCAVIRGTKPDTATVFNECMILDSSTIRIEITYQMSAVPGKGNYEISIISLTENKTLTSFPFYIVVSESKFDANVVTSSNEFQLLVNKINQATEVERVANELVETQRELKAELEVTIADSEAATADSRSATADLRAYHQVVENAENIRISNENTRIANENQRIANENVRQDAEDVRESNEETRQANEEVRETNEETRISNENIRQTNEAARLSNEETRESNENIRQTNEAARIQQATDFANAEAIRVSNEEIRLSNEEIRISNEELRQQQEETRQTNTATAIANAEVATREAHNVVDIVLETLGIDDDPTEEEASLVAYSASKVNSLIQEAKTEINESLDEHIANTENPHEVTAEQIGLGNVDNTADADKSVKHATTAESADTATTLNGLTATVDELNYVDGVTSNIQTQLNNKAASSHTHNYAAASHNQAAGTITAGTLAGQVLANATAVATVTNKQVRNIFANTTEATSGAAFTGLSNGDIYLQYE